MAERDPLDTGLHGALNAIMMSAQDINHVVVYGYRAVAIAPNERAARARARLLLGKGGDPAKIVAAMDRWVRARSQP